MDTVSAEWHNVVPEFLDTELSYFVVELGAAIVITKPGNFEDPAKHLHFVHDIPSAYRRRANNFAKNAELPFDDSGSSKLGNFPWIVTRCAKEHQLLHPCFHNEENVGELVKPPWGGVSVRFN
jgi:hypothetical protein